MTPKVLKSTRRLGLLIALSKSLNSASASPTAKDHSLLLCFTILGIWDEKCDIRTPLKGSEEWGGLTVRVLESPRGNKRRLEHSKEPGCSLRCVQSHNVLLLGL